MRGTETSHCRLVHLPNMGMKLIFGQKFHATRRTTMHLNEATQFPPLFSSTSADLVHGIIEMSKCVNVLEDEVESWSSYSTQSIREVLYSITAVFYDINAIK